LSTTLLYDYTSHIEIYLPFDDDTMVQKTRQKADIIN